MGRALLSPSLANEGLITTGDTSDSTAAIYIAAGGREPRAATRSAATAPLGTLRQTSGGLLTAHATTGVAGALLVCVGAFFWLRRQFTKLAAEAKAAEAAAEADEGGSTKDFEAPKGVDPEDHVDRDGMAVAT
jgi:hypothetical protein